MLSRLLGSYEFSSVRPSICNSVFLGLAHYFFVIYA